MNDFSYAWKTPTNTLFESGILVSTFDYVFVDFFMIHGGKYSNPMDGMGHKHRKLHGKNQGAIKIDRYCHCPLVMQGFSKFF